MAIGCGRQTQNWLIGSWTLVSSTQTENGQTKEYFGSQPLGQVMFDGAGRFSNVSMRGDLPPFKTNNRLTGTADESAAVIAGSIAYFGTYFLEGDTLKFHVIGSTYPNWTNTDQTRTVHLSGDQIKWEVAAPSAGGSLVQIYQRIK